MSIFLVWAKVNSSKKFCYRLLIFLASLSVSLSMRMSCSRTGPLTFRVMIRPLSLPSSMRTRTWMISPVTPVCPMIWMISAGVSSLGASFSSLLIYCAPCLVCSSLVRISLISPVASPSLVMHTDAAGTSMPVAVPIFSLLGTYMYGIFLSSHSSGRCATTSGGSTSSAIMTSLACDRSMALVVSFVPFLTWPVFEAIWRAS
jgi:hypothetical protein